jgi:oleate hydratase
MERVAATGRHYMVGGGISALSAAVLLTRDAGVAGDRITILEHRNIVGGSLDGAGDAETGYLTRGGRMFEPHFVCTLNLLGSIPAPDDPTISIRDDILAFNRMVPGRSECRLVRNGRKAEDRFSLGLRAEDIVALNRLLLTSEAHLDGRRIDDWFAPSFFGNNFWIMWSTMFSFQPWHSLVEMRRYMRRFLHLLPGLTRISGILRTRYNQYDSIVAPIVSWLSLGGVDVRSNCRVADVSIASDEIGRRVTELHLASGEIIAVAPEDRVYLTLGSMTDGTVVGGIDAAPPDDDAPKPGFDLWRRLAARHEGFGTTRRLRRRSGPNGLDLVYRDAGIPCLRGFHGGLHRQPHRHRRSRDLRGFGLDAVRGDLPSTAFPQPAGRSVGVLGLRPEG